MPYEVDSIYVANPADPSSIPKLLLRSSPDAGINAGAYESFNDFLYAPGSGNIYVDARPTAANYTKILALDSKSGTVDYIQTGHLLAVISNGPYQGSLLVSKHKYKHGGGSFDPVEVVSTTGETELTVPGTTKSNSIGTSQTRSWLKDHGWKAVWR